MTREVRLGFTVSSINCKNFDKKRFADIDYKFSNARCAYNFYING